MPKRDLAIHERVLHLVALQEAGKLKQADVREIILKAPFGPVVAIAAQVVAQDDDRKSVDAAIEHVTGGMSKGK